jgi:hypothetical protein
MTFLSIQNDFFQCLLSGIISSKILSTSRICVSRLMIDKIEVSSQAVYDCTSN